MSQRTSSHAGPPPARSSSPPTPPPSPACRSTTPSPHAAGGGSQAAGAALKHFLAQALPRYGERNDPAVACTSGLSPYLHFGHIGAHEVVAAILEREAWQPAMLAKTASGSRAGWWGVSPAAEGFLDQIVTWRELGFNMCFHRPDYADYDSLPMWARTTLAEHAGDERHVYPLAQLEAAATHDCLWNAAQRQLVRDGTIHNYLRMLWGKKILEWSPDPRTALATLTHLNNKYALDGRDPNSYSGIAWILGRYDRAWGPERPVYGKIRYMSSDNTARKLHLADYLARFSA
jgi:deoxyribodipyrimidine photo-lyase